MADTGAPRDGIHEEVPMDVECRSCGYNLRGLAVDGPCPECGEAVSKTVPMCPRCWSRGHEIVVLRLDVDERCRSWTCTRCHGVGFEAGHLRKAVNLAWRDGPPRVREGRVHDIESQMPVSCARCRGRCHAIGIDEWVIIDRCKACGFVWVDVDEWPAVARHILLEFGGGSIPRNMETLLHDPEAIRRLQETRDGRSREFLDAFLTALSMATKTIS